MSICLMKVLNSVDLYGGPLSDRITPTLPKSANFLVNSVIDAFVLQSSGFDTLTHFE